MGSEAALRLKLCQTLTALYSELAAVQRRWPLLSENRMLLAPSSGWEAALRQRLTAPSQGSEAETLQMLTGL